MKVAKLELDINAKYNIIAKYKCSNFYYSNHGYANHGYWNTGITTDRPGSEIALSQMIKEIRAVISAYYVKGGRFSFPQNILFAVNSKF